MLIPESDPVEQEHEDRVFFRVLFFCMVVFGMLMLFTACSSNIPEPACGTTFATVRDLTGLDACGYVLELDNGQRLLPEWQTTFCEEDQNGLFVMYLVPQFPDVNLRDGLRVRINYEETPEVGTYCMAGTPVRLHCLEPISPPEQVRAN